MIELFVSADELVERPAPQHTAEPWHTQIDGGYRTVWTYIEDQTGLMLGAIVQREDAERIVTCINACVGLPSNALEGGILADLFSAIGDILAAGTSDGDDFTCSYEDVNRLSVAFQKFAGALPRGEHAPS